MTQTFTNSTALVIPGGAPTATVGKASLYPSPIDVTGFTNGVITDVNIVLYGFAHTNPADVDILLTATHLPGRDALIMSDVGDYLDVAGLNLVLDDQAAVPLPSGPDLGSGTFRPTNVVGAPDPFTSPAPIPSGNAQLSIFNGQNPNGTWQLWVLDSQPSDVGRLAGGWALQISAEVDL